MQPSYYKYLSIVLGIIAIVFAGLYFMRSEPTIQDINKNLGDRVQSCSGEVSAWNAKYANQASSSEKQKTLQTVLDKCHDELKKGQDTLVQ